MIFSSEALALYDNWEEKIMSSRLGEIFEDEKVLNKIKKRLPYLFKIAELESSRAGKVGMEVGSTRENIIVSLLIYKFGEQNVETNIPITEFEVDVKLFNEPISIKTISGKNLNGIKLKWTVDKQKAVEFQKTYQPSCDMLLVHVNWNNTGGFYFIPLEVQKEVFEKLGREQYIKLPKEGTNPRGVEISKNAIKGIVSHKETKKIEIDWEDPKIEFSPYKRWLDMWRED